jgi:hypothetical protein
MNTTCNLICCTIFIFYLCHWVIYTIFKNVSGIQNYIINVLLNAQTNTIIEPYIIPWIQPSTFFSNLSFTTVLPFDNIK